MSIYGYVEHKVRKELHTYKNSDKMLLVVQNGVEKNTYKIEQKLLCNRQRRILRSN